MSGFVPRGNYHTSLKAPADMDSYHFFKVRLNNLLVSIDITPLSLPPCKLILVCDNLNLRFLSRFAVASVVVVNGDDDVDDDDDDDNNDDEGLQSKRNFRIKQR